MKSLRQNTTLDVGKSRNSSIELLRIISMLMIVLHHYTVHGGVDKASLLESGNFINAYLLQIATLGELGVNIFVLIFGYYSVKSVLTMGKILKLELQVVFYSVVLYVAFCAFGLTDFTIKTFVQNMLPFLFNKYWFYSVYMILFLLLPFLNAALKSITQRQHLYICILSFVLWSVAPSFLLQSMYVNEVLWFFMLYVIAAYIRLYPDCRLNHKRAGIILFAGCFVMMLLSTAAFDVLRNVWVFADYQTHFFAGKTSFAMGAAIGLLIIFLNVKPFYNKVINVVGGCTFGVYLIHDNNYVRPFLWNTVFRNTDFADSNILILHMVFAVVAVFVACTAMEWCRKKFVERIYANKISEI